MIGAHVSDVFPDMPGIIQFYTHNTKPYQKYESARRLAKSGRKFYIHSTFNTIPGNNTFKFFMRDQAKAAANFGAAGLVVHIPNKKSVSEIVEAFDIDLWPMSTIIYMEHVPGKYADPKLLKLLYDQLSAKYNNVKFGICIDTCHIYVSDYDLGNKKIMTDYVNAIDAIGCPVLVHLNDSVGEIGSMIDRHGIIGTRIWSEGNCEALAVLLAKKWDCIIELDYESKFGPSMEFVNYVLDKFGLDK